MADETEVCVARLDELAPGAMRQVEAGGETILLCRDSNSDGDGDGAGVHAVGGRCPHAGANLAEGVLHGGRVICPWHKAAFCVASGACLEPPAVDDLPRYQVRVADGRIFVRLPAAARSRAGGAADDATDGRHFVIVGGGAAGAVAAQTLRREGFGGRVTMIDREGRVPYDRTVLSKYWLSGEQGAEKTPLQPQRFYAGQAIGRVAAEVVRADPAARVVSCADGRVFAFDALLVASGGAPKMPDIPGVALNGVFALRSRADAEAILARAERSARAVVIGASFIGMEVAASLRERGLDVVVVGKESAPFERQLGARVGGAFVLLHVKRGVRFRLGCEVSAIEGAGEVRAVVLGDGSRIEADLVVIGFGVSPVTGFVDGVVTRDDGGIEVDAELRAADGVFAAGDVAWFPARGEGARIRVEHWRVAEQQGRVAALNMLGRGMRYESVPVFWTIQYMKRLDYVGHAEAWDDVVVHGDLGKPEFLAYYVKDGLVRAAVGMDRDRDTTALIALFEMRRDWTAADLGDAPAGVLAGLATGW